MGDWSEVWEESGAKEMEEGEEEGVVGAVVGLVGEDEREGGVGEREVSMLEGGGR